LKNSEIIFHLIINYFQTLPKAKISRFYEATNHL
jgi:hypothetical protein